MISSISSDISYIHINNLEHYYLMLHFLGNTLPSISNSKTLSIANTKKLNLLIVYYTIESSNFLEIVQIESYHSFKRNLKTRLTPTLPFKYLLSNKKL